MVITSIADITGDNNAHAIGSGQARAIFLTATGGKARFGDGNVSATQGVELPQDVTVTIRASEADATDYINLAQLKAYVPTSTTLTIATAI